FTLVYASNVYLLYLWAFLMGCASCFVYIPALTSVQRWYPARRGLVSGIVNLTFGISAAVMSPIFGWMLNALGYVPMLLIMAIIAGRTRRGPVYRRPAPDSARGASDARNSR